MKALSNIISALFITTFLTACTSALLPETPTSAPIPLITESTAEKPESAKPSLSETGLYILPDQAFKTDHLNEALDSILANNQGIDNLIFYVHGRGCGGGGEPAKSLKEVVPFLESDYTAKALIFYWPGSDDDCPAGFPKNQAQTAAPALTQVLKGLQTYKQDKKTKLTGIKLTLLLHSMGNNVFEVVLRDYQKKSLDSDLFDTIVLNSSATESRGHDKWLKKLDFSLNQYITVNNHDLVLRGGGFSNLSARLGRSLETAGVRPVPLTNNAIYVDFTDTGVNHRYFISSGQENNSYLKQFYDLVLNGRKFEFEGFEGIKKTKTRDGANLYYFKKD